MIVSMLNIVHQIREKVLYPKARAMPCIPVSPASTTPLRRSPLERSCCSAKIIPAVQIAWAIMPQIATKTICYWKVLGVECDRTVSPMMKQQTAARISFSMVGISTKLTIFAARSNSLDAYFILLARRWITQFTIFRAAMYNANISSNQGMASSLPVLILKSILRILGWLYVRVMTQKAMKTERVQTRQGRKGRRLMVRILAKSEEVWLRILTDVSVSSIY